jgi:hypothetical protein
MDATKITILLTDEVAIYLGIAIILYHFILVYSAPYIKKLFGKLFDKKKVGF